MHLSLTHEYFVAVPLFRWRLSVRRPPLSCIHRTWLLLCRFSGVLSTVYVVGLLACLLVGGWRGPNVFERSDPDLVPTDSLNVTWYGKVEGMERWHQVS